MVAAQDEAVRLHLFERFRQRAMGDAAEDALQIVEPPLAVEQPVNDHRPPFPRQEFERSFRRTAAMVAGHRKKPPSRRVVAPLMPRCGILKDRTCKYGIYDPILQKRRNGRRNARRPKPKKPRQERRRS